MKCSHQTIFLLLSTHNKIPMPLLSPAYSRRSLKCARVFIVNIDIDRRLNDKIIYKKCHVRPKQHGCLNLIKSKQQAQIASSAKYIFQIETIRMPI